MLLRNGSSDRMGKGSFGLIGKNHFIFVYNPNKKQTLILVGIVMWLKTYFRHGFQNLTTNKDTWQISNKNSNNTRYKKRKWEWIRHILRKGNANIIYQTLQVKRLKWHTDSKKIFFWHRNWKLKKKQNFTIRKASRFKRHHLLVYKHSCRNCTWKQTECCFEHWI